MNTLLAVLAVWAGASVALGVAWSLVRRPARRRAHTGAWWCTRCGASGVDTARTCTCPTT